MITFSADLSVLKAPVDLAGDLAPAVSFSAGVTLVTGLAGSLTPAVSFGADLSITAGAPHGPRPYGVGPYGVGPYSRWPALPGIFDVAADSSIVFAAKARAGGVIHTLQLRSSIVFAAAAKPATVRSLHAASGIVFNARALGLHRIIHPYAISQIVFTADADVRVSWAAWAPCEPAGWQSPAPCDDGAWTSPGGCSAGVWTETRLP